MSDVRFSDLKIEDDILEAVDRMGFEEPTDIQREAIPPILEGRDVVGQAKTGTGKTAAFGIPMVQHCEPDWANPASLILTPTRELAEQVSEEINRLGQVKGVDAFAIYGGTSYEPQLRALDEGRPVFVGTPGRTMDHMRKGNLELDYLDFFCLDEADRMLDMGFIDDIRWVLDRVPDRGVQKLLFSATIPEEIMQLTEDMMTNPVRVVVSEDDLTVDETHQVYINVGYRNKVWALYRVLESEKPELAMVFCRTKREVDKVYGLLESHGFPVEKMHGDMSQAQRERALEDVREGDTRIVVATNVLARGIDVTHCSHVINYDIPDNPEWYVHRIGRTSRMGREGKAITFVTSDEYRDLLDIETITESEVELRDVPDPDHLDEDKITKVRDWKELSDPLDMVHFEFGVGKEDGLKMMDVFDAIKEDTGLDDRNLGTIHVESDRTIVEVPLDEADDFYDHYKGGTIEGHEARLHVVDKSDELRH
jgi:ATP-dependent RNA helicase DeaD